MFRSGLFAAAAAACLLGASAAAQAPPRPHNVILFVADGLRHGSVTAEVAPALAAVRDGGVNFANSHSVFPTLTTVNASAIATGHLIGDTGNFANSLYPGMPWLEHAAFSRLPFLEDDLVLGDMNARFGGNYTHEKSLMEQAAAHGFAVAAVGKTGPVGIQYLAGLGASDSVLVDDAAGTPTGLAIPPALAQRIEAAHLAATAPFRNRPNTAQQDWFTSVATDVLLPMFRDAGKPFFLVFWSGDPDFTQHNQTDSLDTLTPGINGATSRAAVANASSNLERLRAALAAQHLDADTDIFVTADHGFSTISKASSTSYAASLEYRDSPKGQLPPGFVGIDLAHALHLKLFQPNGLDVALEQGIPPRQGSAMLGADFEHPQVLIAANGGSDLIYLPGAHRAALARRVVGFLAQQDYTGALFVDDALGATPGALRFSDIGLAGAAVTPRPSIIVSFRSHATGCDVPEMCAVTVVDSPLRQGQGMHGSFSRADTYNFMAAIGPDFREHAVDAAPIGNADIAPTLAAIMGFELTGNGRLKGRVATEALRTGGPAPAFAAETIRSRPAANGFVTVLNRQKAGDQVYFDAAGAPGRVVGLKP